MACITYDHQKRTGAIHICSHISPGAVRFA